MSSKDKPSIEDNYLAQESLNELLFSLSPVDRKILKMLLEGCSEKEIAKALGIHISLIIRNF